MAININGILIAQSENVPVEDDPNPIESYPISGEEHLNENGQLNDNSAQSIQPVTQKNFDVLESTVANVQEDISLPLGLPVGDVAATTAVLAIVEFIALIILFVTLSNATSKIRQLISESRNQNNAAKEMSKKITSLENEIHELKSNVENQRHSNEQNFIQQINKFPQQPQPATAANYNAPPPPPIVKYQNFVDDFNRLTQQISTSGDPFEAKKFSNEFMRRYEIQEFSCANFEARVSEPVPPPQFSMTRNGDFWAYEYEPGIFAVVPSIAVRQYTNNHHDQRAMGDVFNSNFESGRNYRKIFVNAPAIFKGMWNLSKKGDLELS